MDNLKSEKNNDTNLETFVKSFVSYMNFSRLFDRLVTFKVVFTRNTEKN